MSDTPRTDAGCFVAVMDNGIFCKPSIARELERDLARVTAELETLKATLAREIKWGHGNCSKGNCMSSGENCSMNSELPKFKEPGQ